MRMESSSTNSLVTVACVLLFGGILYLGWREAMRPIGQRRFPLRWNRDDEGETRPLMQG